MTWPVSQSGQTFFQGNRLGTSPLPLHSGHSCSVGLRFIESQKVAVMPS